MSICVLVPSRGRPERAKAMADSVHKTAEGAVKVFVIVDHDDPRLDDYGETFDLQGQTLDSPTWLEIMSQRRGYTGALNAYASGDPITSHVDTYPLWDEYTILGAFGDDVLFRTFGWDLRIEETLKTPGIAYGNDLVHAAGHPTAIFMSSVIAKALGYLAIPQSRHLWVDDAWKLLGQKTDTLRYVPDCIFEHMHPVVHKAEMDQTYHEVYDGVLGHKDHLGFLDWEANHAESDAAKVRTAIGA